MYDNEISKIRPPENLNTLIELCKLYREALEEIARCTHTQSDRSHTKAHDIAIGILSRTKHEFFRD
jgi:hypothetical protein